MVISRVFTFSESWQTLQIQKQLDFIDLTPMCMEFHNSFYRNRKAAGGWLRAEGSSQYSKSFILVC